MKTKNNSLKIVKYSAYALMLGALAVTSSLANELPPIQQLPITIELSKALPAGLTVTGTKYSIDKSVQNDGFVNIYRLNTPYRDIRVESNAKLRVRIQELQAIADIEAMKKSDIFKTSLKKGAKAPYNTVKGLVTEPVDTVSNVATGVGNWFSDVGHSIVSSDPNQDNAFKTAFGYSAVKRKYAYELGVDPYSNYEPLQEAITDISQVAFTGGILPKAAFGAVKNTAGTILSLTSTADGMKKLARDKSPAELKEINTEKLKKIGVPSDSIKQFLNNYNFNPYEATLLVGELVSMDGVEQRRNLIEVAARADSAASAFYLRLQAQMMASYHLNVAKVVKLLAVDSRTVMLQKKDTSLVGFAPLDYVPSTSRLWQRLDALSNAINKVNGGRSGKELWITGQFTPEVRLAMEGMGWRVEEKAGKKLFVK